MMIYASNPFKAGDKVIAWWKTTWLEFEVIRTEGDQVVVDSPIGEFIHPYEFFEFADMPF